MSFIAKNPLSIPNISSDPPIPTKGTRGIFAKDDGWYEIDDTGNIIKIANINDTKTYTDEKTRSETSVRVDFARELDGNVLPGAVGGFTRIIFHGNDYGEPTAENTIVLTLLNSSGELASFHVPAGFTGNDTITFDPSAPAVTWNSETLGVSDLTEQGNAFLTAMAQATILSIMDGYANYPYADVSYYADLETAAKNYADEKDAENLGAAKSYADSKDAETLSAAKVYADAKVDKSGFDDKVWNAKKQEQIGVNAPWGGWQADGIGICSTLTNSEFKAFGNVYFNYDGERISLKTSDFTDAQDNWLGNSEQYPYIYVYNGTDFDASNADETKFDYGAQFYVLGSALSTIINQLDNDIDELSSGFDNKVYNAKGQGDRVGVNAPWGGWQADGLGITSKLTNVEFKAFGNVYFNYDGERIQLKTSDFTDAQDNWLGNKNEYPYIYVYNGTDFDASNADETKFDTSAQFYILGSTLSEDINSREKSADKGVPNGYAPLDASGVVPNKHLYNVLPYTTASGYPLSVSDHLDGENVIDYKVHGNSMQDGTPSPEAPVEIKSTGDLVTDTSSEHYGKYDIPITVCGKNLFDYHQYTTQITQNGLTIKYLEDEQCFLINGTSAISANYFTKYLNIKITPNTYYSISTRYVSGSINKTACTTEQKYTTVYFGKGDAANTITNWADCKLDITDNVKQNKLNDKNYITAVWFYIHPNIVFNNYKVKIQIEKNKSATQYEQYTDETKHIYLDAPLRKVGDYADYVDYKNQKVVRCVDVLDDTSTKNISESYGALSSPTEEPITVPELTAPNSSVMHISSGTATQPSQIDLTYYQDINKVITNLTNAILAQGGNV